MVEGEGGWGNEREGRGRREDGEIMREKGEGGWGNNGRGERGRMEK